MSKYSNELKLEIVKYCIEGYHSKYDAAKKFNIPSPTPIDDWVRKYKEHGVEGLIKQKKSSYSGEFKQNVVEYMHSNHLSATETAIHFRIVTKVVLKWVRKYKEHGAVGLIKNTKKYDGKFKQNVVEYMHNNHLSLTETAIKFNIGNHNVVGKWERIYYEEGPQGLYIERRGRSKNMSSKPKKKKLDNEEDLIEEVQRLRMENEYLKKLNALVQERIKRENKKK